jgi:quercetin dioxygenase-like cupin family protein
MKVERIPWVGGESPAETSLRQKLEGEGFEVVVWRDRSNWAYEPHRHEHDESLWVVRGSLLLQIEGQDYALGPGDRLMLPAETLHTARVGPDGATYLIGQKR